MKKLRVFQFQMPDEVRYIASANMKQAVLYAVSVLDYVYEDIESVTQMGEIDIDGSYR